MLAVVYSLSSGYAHNACLQPAPRLAATSRSAVMPIRVASVSMQIAGQVACEVRKLPKSSVALDITVPADISNKVHQAVLTELGKNANVPGFRKGKAPPEALLNHVGTHKVKKATVEEVIDLGMKQSAQQVQVRAAGEARLESPIDSIADDYSLGEELKFTVCPRASSSRSRSRSRSPSPSPSPSSNLNARARARSSLALSLTHASPGRGHHVQPTPGPSPCAEPRALALSPSPGPSPSPSPSPIRP